MTNTICAYYIPMPTYSENGMLENRAVPHTISIENTYENMRSFVGGLLERISIQVTSTTALDFWFNEEGKLLDLPPSAVIADDEGKILDYICGNTLVLASTYDESGDELNISLEGEVLEKLISEILSPIRPFTIGENQMHYAIKMP